MMRKLPYILIIILCISSFCTAAYFYQKNKESEKLLRDPTTANQQELKIILEKVSKLMQLPKSEEPTLATVEDVAKLKDQEFFANAKNGDKMLVYTIKKEIILYRPSTNKIINVAPITINQPETSPEATLKDSSQSQVLSETPTQAPTNTPVPTVIETQTP